MASNLITTTARSLLSFLAKKAVSCYLVYFLANELLSLNSDGTIPEPLAYLLRLTVWTAGLPFRFTQSILHFAVHCMLWLVASMLAAGTCYHVHWWYTRYRLMKWKRRRGLHPIVEVSSHPASREEASTSTVTRVRTRSARFYQETLIFEVQGVLYKIPKDTLISNSETFRDMYSLNEESRAIGQSQEGLSDEHPIVLDSIERSAWECLLLALLEPSTATLSQHTFEDWLAVLSLSRQYVMPRVHKQARDSLDLIFASDLKSGAYEYRSPALFRIQLAREYNNSAWLKNGLLMILSRDDPASLTAEEKAAMDGDMAEKLWAIKRSLGSLLVDCEEDEYTCPTFVKAVNRLFGEEIKRMNADFRHFYGAEAAHWSWEANKNWRAGWMPGPEGPTGKFLVKAGGMLLRWLVNDVLLGRDSENDRDSERL